MRSLPPKARSARSLERSADKLAHDFAGSAIDAADAGISPDPRDRIFVHIARPAVELQRRIAGLPLHLGIPILDRKSVGQGKSVSVRVYPGGRRINTKKICLK